MSTLAAENVVQEILAERRRQIEAEGYSAAHDDGYNDGALARAAAAYALLAGTSGWPLVIRPATNTSAPSWWPWRAKFWKPKDARRDLTRAAALLVAEIERLDRAAERAAA
jgi:hypothetical protein